MNIKKTLLSAAVTAALTTAVAAPVQAATIDMDFDGLFTMLTSKGKPLQNNSLPYYYDSTWNNGKRTQISGTMQFDTVTGYGTGTVGSFDFYDGGPAVASAIEFQSIGGGLMLGAMQFSWNGSDIATQIVLNGSGLFAEMPTIAVGDVYDATSCGVSGACVLPASNGAANNSIPIGLVPIATSTLNVQGTWGDWDGDTTTPDTFQVIGGKGNLTTLADLGFVAGTDDGIGGSPMDNGPFSGFNANFDMTVVTVTGITAPPIPVPAAVWLFGSGLLGLVGVARRRKMS